MRCAAHSSKRVPADIGAARDHASDDTRPELGSYWHAAGAESDSNLGSDSNRRPEPNRRRGLGYGGFGGRERLRDARGWHDSVLVLPRFRAC
jgi:hypothetical protein